MSDPELLSKKRGRLSDEESDEEWYEKFKKTRMGYEILGYKERLDALDKAEKEAAIKAEKQKKEDLAKKEAKKAADLAKWREDIKNKKKKWEEALEKLFAKEKDSYAQQREREQWYQYDREKEHYAQQQQQWDQYAQQQREQYAQPQWEQQQREQQRERQRKGTGTGRTPGNSANGQNKTVLEILALNTLGLSDGASIDEITKAYRKLALKTHPDREGGDAEKFIEIKGAYDLLTKTGGNNKRKTNKRKTNKRKTNKRKTNKRKTK